MRLLAPVLCLVCDVLTLARGFVRINLGCFRKGTIMSEPITIVGGGLAGSEAAWQLANRGFSVRLYEMRPVRPTEAHVTDRLAELVCSNSMGSTLPDRALGILKNELLGMGSLIMRIAFRHALPAGSALAVSREDFAEEVTATIGNHPKIEVIRNEVEEIPSGPTILATGPLTSPTLTFKRSRGNNISTFTMRWRRL
jgi:methylenetetrahydrofolate--tRNA-(uracil-5-)-methyltransferase